MSITMVGNLVCTLSKKNELFKMHLIKRTNISIEARKNINIQYEKELIKNSFNNLKRMKIASTESN